MNFLAPFFLLGGLALAAPILYHLIRRTTRERTRFSSLMFLVPSPPRISKRHRLQHIFLLILRCLALALLAFGFARPFLTQKELDDPTVARPKRTVVLVDVSASMRREGIWTAARDRVADVINRAGLADQVAIVTFDRRATVLVSFEEWNRTAPTERSAFAVARLGGVAPTWAGTHLGNALITAAETLAETEGKDAPGPRQIVLVSDLQAGSRLEGLQAYEWPKGVALLVEPVKARNATNAGVHVVAEPVDSVRAADAPVRVRVTNAADSKREQFKIGWGNGTATGFAGAALDAYVPPGQSRIFALPLPKDVAVAGQVVLRGDDEEFDNAAYFIPPVQQRASVLWIGNDAPGDLRQPLFFLQRAFSDTPRLAVQVVSRRPDAALAPEELGAANVIFVADPVSAATAGALREQALAGKTLIVVPKGPELAPTLGALLGRDAVGLGEMRPTNYAMLAEIDFQHPLFAPFADPRFSDFTKIHIWKYRKLDPRTVPDARVVAKFDSGDPALVEVPAGRGRVFVLTTGWQPDDSQLAVSSKFVPLLWSWLELGGGLATPPAPFTIGDVVLVVSAGTPTTVRGPGGVDVALAANATEFAATLQPGIYEVLGGTRPQRFAVNLDANENRTAPLGLDELEKLGVPVAQTQPAVAALPADKKTLLQGIEAENRQKLWRWFIAATLAVLLVESALAGWTARRGTMKTPEAAS